MFILVFGLNLLGEMTDGHCGEACHSTQIEQQSSSGLSLSKGSKLTHPPEPSSQHHESHSCHFGHCAHVVLMHVSPAPVLAPEESAWVPYDDRLVSHHSALLFRPPIV